MQFFIDFAFGCAHESARAQRSFREAVLLAFACLLVALSSTGAWAAADCASGSADAASANAVSLDTLAFQPFGAAEIGWRIYVPLVAAEIDTACPPDSPMFADRLARWQSARHRPATGRFTPDAFAAMYARWQAARPFTTVSRVYCPDPPTPEHLSATRGGESYGRVIALRSGALAAWRALMTAARADGVPGADARALRIFSGYRSPDYDAARCVIQQNCDGRRRARCSAHRTGLALDVFLAELPGVPIDSSAYANRRAAALSPAFGWLAANARRFGFVNYAFEPWHWEWTGEPI